MIICHSIATEEELTFVKYLKNLMDYIDYAQEGEDISLGRELYKVYSGSRFDEVNDLVHISSVKIFFSEALKFAIGMQKDEIAFNLIQYSKQMIY